MLPTRSEVTFKLPHLRRIHSTKIMDQDQGKNESAHLEVVGGGGVGNGNEIMDPLKPKTTLFMTFFSLYIGLAGWIYNFDLGTYFVFLL